MGGYHGQAHLKCRPIRQARFLFLSPIALWLARVCAIERRTLNEWKERMPVLVRVLGLHLP
jgi:hypothetical protein